MRRGAACIRSEGGGRGALMLPEEGREGRVLKGWGGEGAKVARGEVLAGVAESCFLAIPATPLLRRPTLLRGRRTDRRPVLPPIAYHHLRVCFAAHEKHGAALDVHYPAPPPPFLLSPPHSPPHSSLSPPSLLLLPSRPPNSTRFSPENPSMSVTTTETTPPVGAPLSRLRVSNRLWSSCGRLFLRSRKNLGMT